MTGQPIQLPGEPVDLSLAEILGVSENDPAFTRLRRDFDRIREAEQSAMRDAASTWIVGCGQGCGQIRDRKIEWPS